MSDFRIKYFRILKILLLYMQIHDVNSVLSIDVSKGRCGSTIDLAKHGQVYLNYKGEAIVPDGCTYTFTNNDRNKEICIRQNHGQSNMNCILVLSYCIGQLNRYNDKSCMDFLSKPLCTKENKVFASFTDTFVNRVILLSKAHVVIYLQNPRSTISPTTRRPRTNDNNDIPSGDDGWSSTSTIALTGICLSVFLLFCCICCARYRRRSSKPAPNQRRDRMNYTPNQRMNQISIIPNQGFDQSLPGTLHEGNGTQQHGSPVIPLNSNYDWGPPSYDECADQLNNGPDTSHTSGNQPHINPYTITTGTQEITEKEHGASDEIEPPPSYESLTSISHL